MNLSQAKTALRDIANKMVEGVDGVATMPLVAEFKSNFGTELDDLSAGLFDDWLRRVARDVVANTGRGHTTQLSLPGMGSVDAFVTVPDGEGGYRRKKYIYASTTDIYADQKVHDDNYAAVGKARSEARQRDGIVLPVMEEHGFATAGEAITWLNAPDATPGADG